ncbi:LOW QUALITY PROTEIN: uncharacterized protein LOC128355311 [Scomber scombrus]|uniref:LOW QUALITY PROTEIN: uncharacterized protein LOC128355311 n=1 Tax=Scomber scombrus TaxID=13677 RepID=A0AAV1N2D2_SCOSC
MLTQDIQLKPFFHPCTPGYVSLWSRCQWAPVQQRLCSASWTGVNRRNVEAVKLLDYQAAHSTAFDGLVCDYWHHYTDRSSFPTRQGVIRGMWPVGSSDLCTFPVDLSASTNPPGL